MIHLSGTTGPRSLGRGHLLITDPSFFSTLSGSFSSPHGSCNEAELELLLEQIATVRAVGEVGLDGSPRFRPHYQVQRRIFEAVIRRCAELGARTLSIHSRRAVKDILSTLEQYPGFGTAVMHWFSGKLGELKDAEAHGCWFSIGPAMFESAHGRSLAAKMPRDRVVPESDGPFAKVAGNTVMPWSAVDTAERLSAEWGTSVDETEGTRRAGWVSYMDWIGTTQVRSRRTAGYADYDTARCWVFQAWTTRAEFNAAATRGVLPHFVARGDCVLKRSSSLPCQLSTVTVIKKIIIC
jgi:Tat protein secretion system quality control protein TatD with DNase activity